MPEVVLDLHGDISKTSCTIDPTTLQILPGALAFPTALCAEGSDRDAVVLSPFEFTEDGDDYSPVLRSRTLASRLAQRVDSSGFGKVNRFAPINTGTGAANDGGINSYNKLGILVSGWEPQFSPCGKPVCPESQPDPRGDATAAAPQWSGCTPWLKS